MHLQRLADFHVCDGGVKARDHHAGAADELQRLTADVGGVEHRAVVEGACVMRPAGLADVLPFDRRGAAAASAAAFTAAAFPVVLMAAAGMLFAVMVAVCPRILQFAPEVSRNCLVGVSGSACAELDTLFNQRLLSAAADAAAEQLGGDRLAVRDLIDLELLRMTEVLKYRSVLMCHCNSHL